jgi:hypothetical protein
MRTNQNGLTAKDRSYQAHLIARKSEDCETLAVVFVIQCLQLLVVSVSVATSTCNIDNEYHLGRHQSNLSSMNDAVLVELISPIATNYQLLGDCITIYWYCFMHIQGDQIDWPKLSLHITIQKFVQGSPASSSDLVTCRKETLTGLDLKLDKGNGSPAKVFTVKS